MIFFMCVIVGVAAFLLVIFNSTQSAPSNVKTFVYEWPSSIDVMFGGQKIINGTLRLNITFESTNNSANIVATINDDDYNGYDFLGLVFDLNGNGFIDVGGLDYPYMLFASNRTYYRNHGVVLTKDGTIWTPIELAPMKSFQHNCTFIEGIGYTFNIRLSKSEFSLVKANMVYVYFYDRNVLSYTNEWKWSPWVSVMIEGWQ